MNDKIAKEVALSENWGEENIETFFQQNPEIAKHRP
jgi:hypothetical protein